jgi:hypothetical protein
MHFAEGEIQMQILVSIDDTDNLESRGTGHLASQLASELEAKGWGRSGFVTRHQLFVHPDIPYTSHNSAMCFSADVAEDALERVVDHAAGLLGRESATGSDPGLCVAVIERLERHGELAAFGRQAKSMILSRDEAFSVAGRCGMHLSEHGGSGQGVIGAVAAVALRLVGNDGRLRGRLRLGPVGSTFTVAEFCRQEEIDSVRTLDGRSLNDGERVRLGEKAKTVLLDGRSVLLVIPVDAAGGALWQTCPRELLRNY